MDDFSNGGVVLEVQHLCKVYKRATRRNKNGRLNAVSDVSFTVNGGEIVGFLGPNGAGKSTTIKMITGLATPTSGSVKVCGHDVQKEPTKAKAHIGGVIESPDLYMNLSAEENLKLFASLRTKEDLINPLEREAESRLSYKELVEKRIENLLKLVGLYDRRKDVVKKYSLGMKQRLGIAQAIMEYPKLLILDEPANGLDPAGIKGVRMLLKKLASEYGMAIMVSSHQLAEMQLLCERVIIIDNGKIVASSMLDEMQEDDAAGIVKKARIIIKTDNAHGVAEFLNGKDEGSAEVIDTTHVALETEKSSAEINKELIFGGYNVFGVEVERAKLEDIYINATKEDI